VQHGLTAVESGLGHAPLALEVLEQLHPDLVFHLSPATTMLALDAQTRPLYLARQGRVHPQDVRWRLEARGLVGASETLLGHPPIRRLR